jgi:hypothetical protein
VTTTGKQKKAPFLQAASNIGQSILDSVGEIPLSTLRKSEDARAESRTAIAKAAGRASLTAGALAVPMGPIGWLTILPEMIAVWRIQGQLVADIAALHGHKAELTREQMIFCLFRHTAAQAVRDLAVRAGERLVVQHVTQQVLKKIAEAIGVKIARRVAGKGITRWLPVIGVVGVAGYAYFDTAQVGATALELFEKPARSRAKG